jgi:hypothetical protein
VASLGYRVDPTILLSLRVVTVKSCTWYASGSATHRGLSSAVDRKLGLSFRANDLLRGSSATEKQMGHKSDSGK